MWFKSVWQWYIHKVSDLTNLRSWISIPRAFTKRKSNNTFLLSHRSFEIWTLSALSFYSRKINLPGVLHRNRNRSSEIDVRVDFGDVVRKCIWKCLVICVELGVSFCAMTTQEKSADYQTQKYENATSDRYDDVEIKFFLIVCGKAWK